MLSNTCRSTLLLKFKEEMTTCRNGEMQTQHNFYGSHNHGMDLVGLLMLAQLLPVSRQLKPVYGLHFIGLVKTATTKFPMKHLSVQEYILPCDHHVLSVSISGQSYVVRVIQLGNT